MSEANPFALTGKPTGNDELRTCEARSAGREATHVRKLIIARSLMGRIKG